MGINPREMTLLDVVALVAGFAVAFTMLTWPEVSLRPRAVLDSWGAIGPPLWLTLLAEVVPLGLPVGFAVAAVVVARRLRDGLPPRASEWTTILIGVALIVLAFPPGDEVTDFRDVLIGTAAVTVGFLVVVAGRRRIPRRAQTLLLVLLLWLVIRWPACSAARETRYLIWSFYSLYSPPQVTSSWPFRLHEGILIAAGLFPFGMVLGIPLIATLRQGTRLWTWTDWVGVITAFGLLPSAITLIVIAPYRYVWESEPFTLAAWVLAAPTFSAPFAVVLAPKWNLWFWSDPEPR